MRSKTALFSLLLAALLPLGAPSATAQEPFSQIVAQSAVSGAAGGKNTLSPVERKIDTNLLYATRAFAPTRGAIPQAIQPNVQSFIDANVAADQTVFVVINADVSPELVAALKVTGAYDISEFPQYATITARVPITAIVDIAQRSDVHSIGPRQLRQLNRYIPTPEELAAAGGSTTNAGSVQWQGVGAHKADIVQNAGISGTGVMVCVLSDGVFSLAGRQATGDLPPSVFILPGQGNQVSGNDEGTAMLEIVHDMAPGASLGFATADPSDAQFATNITGLQAAGCKIIVDDVTYFDEGAFQDDIVAQAVNTVTAAGVLYFSSAANSGSLLHASSGTHEHDFVASAAAIPAAILAQEGPPPAAAFALHQFGANPYTMLTATTNFISLKWGSPLSKTDSTDYDLFVMDSTGTTILAQSTIDQYNGGAAGIHPPYEIAQCSTCPFPVGTRIYVIRYAGTTARALRLDTNRGVITPADATTGSTFGHNAAGSAFSVASIGYNGGAFLTSTPWTGGTGVHVDYYSSDGPRKIFYNPNSTVITPGNILFATGGGITLPKVDITASDCGSTTTPGFTPFCGTSAAAPTAASIAALIKSAKPTATAAAVTTALKNSALDIEAAGTDITSGVGIVMADSAVRGVLATLTTSKTFVPLSITTGGTSTLTITLQNTNAVAITGVAFTDTYPPQIKNGAAPNPLLAGGCTGTLTAVATGGSLGLSSGSIPAGTTCTITVTVTSSTVGGPWNDPASAVTTTILLMQNIPAAGLTVTAVGAPPVLQSKVSRKVHGAVPFDLGL